MSNRQKAYNSRGRFEQWAKNPACEANAISAVHGISMDKVVEIEGFKGTRGQSPFAISRGKLFEGALFEENGKRLIDEMKTVGNLPKDAEVAFKDFRQTSDKGPYRNIDESLAATVNYLKEIASQADRYYLLAGPVVVIPGSKVMLPEALLIIDAVFLKPSKSGNLEAYVGEVKTYPDRGGYTDKSNLGSARAQAGIYVHALQLVVEDLALTDQIIVNKKGFLVLSKPGSNMPSVRPNEDLRYLSDRAKKGFEKLRVVADGLVPTKDEEILELVKNAEISYREDCFTFCDRAPKCLAIARKAGLPIVLGHEMERYLGGITLHRAVELLEGAAPSSDQEKEFVRKAAVA